MGFLDWLKAYITPNSSRESEKKRRREADEEEEEIEELVALEII